MATKKKKALSGPRGGKTTVTKSGKLRTVIFLEPEEKRALKVAAAERDCSASDLAQEAIRRFLGLD